MVREAPFKNPNGSFAKCSRGHSLRIVKYLAYGWSSSRSQPAIVDQVEAALDASRYTGWDGLVAAMRAAGAEVEVIEQRPDAPDMVYAMNLGFAVESPEGPLVSSAAGHVVMSHMRYAERRMETPAAATWFAGRERNPATPSQSGAPDDDSDCTRPVPLSWLNSACNPLTISG